ncbi:MAG: c-type cytochrome [Rudanella sp.]|nr:c-type cytochrome [Rudanella sp.]
MKTLILTLICALLLTCQQRPVGTPPKLSPELQKALDGLSVAEGFRVELVAAEPLIADPVAMEIDEDGRLFVIEMHGYPLDLSGTGQVKLLKDTNADGYPDQSVVWADSLILPTGLMRWKKGLIVTDPPYVWYLEDTNGDDRADLKKPLLTGFARSNPQHNLNNPIFGIDNWIYMAHQWAITPSVCKKEFADEGAEIRFPDNPKAPTLGKNGEDRNVRFRPDSYELEALSGESQFGHTFDPWGHHFLTENAKHLYHEAIAARYLRRNPNLLIPDATQSISDHNDACEVFPTTENPHHQLLTDVGVISSACGVTWYNGNAFPTLYNDNTTFVAEPVHNLVHVDRIRDNGASFSASRIDSTRDFLTSKDAWFRPVNFYVGPDGALYVVDYYRQIVEHPEWMSDEVNQSGALYAGTNKGRIYRIVPKSGLPMDWLGRLNLSKMADKDLISQLENPNGWYRRTAQRLLFERKSPAIDGLRELARTTKRPEARVHALWLLDGLQAIDTQTLTDNLAHENAGVRENALRIAERHLARFPQLTPALLALRNDPSPKVRYQLACTLGNLPQTPAITAAQLTILERDLTDKWVQIATLSSAPGRETNLLAEALRRFANKNTEASRNFLLYAAATIANTRQEKSIRQLLNLALNSTASGPVRASLLTGMQQVWANTSVPAGLTDADKQQLLNQFSAQTEPTLRQAALQLLGTVGLPRSASEFARKTAWPIAQNRLANEALRADAVYLLSLANPVGQPPLLQTFVRPSESMTVQFAALKTLDNSTDNQPCSYLFSQWSTLPKALQATAIDAFMKRESWTGLLLDAVAGGTVKRESLSWRQMVRLMNNDDLRLRAKARKVLANGGLTREAVLAAYQPSLNQTGRAANGKAIFARTCAPCHQLNGEGIAFGPELNSLRNRPAANILESILIPSRAIADKFEYWQVELTDGTTVEGIMAAKTPTSYTLRLMGGQQQTIAASRVKRLTATPNSAMPEGLEQAISVPDMSDLLAYIRKK